MITHRLPVPLMCDALAEPPFSLQFDRVPPTDQAYIRQRTQYAIWTKTTHLG
jgi:hypothetical protein